MQIEIKNKAKNQKAIITRSLLSDGYNYYIMLLNLNSSTGQWYWNEGWQTYKSIYSLREAKLIAKGALRVFNII